MRPSWECVDASQNVTVRIVEYAMKSPFCGRAIHEKRLVSGTDHSETVDPVDASNFMIVLSDTTNRWSLNQTRPVLNRGVTITGISMSK